MSDEQDGCEWVNVSSGTGLPRYTHSRFYRPDALPAAQPTASKH